MAERPGGLRTTRTVGLTDVTMVSATTGWAVGGSGVLLKTSQRRCELDRTELADGGGSLGDLVRSGRYGRLLVGNAALPNWTIYKTTNSGTTWTAVSGLGATGAVNLTGVSLPRREQRDRRWHQRADSTHLQRRHHLAQPVGQQHRANCPARRAAHQRQLRIKTVGDVGMVFYTSNGGGSWFTTMLGNNALLAPRLPRCQPRVGWSATTGRSCGPPTPGEWETQASGITVWRGVHFLNPTTGWVVGDGGLDPAHDRRCELDDQTSGTTQQLNGVWVTSATRRPSLSATEAPS